MTIQLSDGASFFTFKKNDRIHDTVREDFSSSPISISQTNQKYCFYLFLAI